MTSPLLGSIARSIYNGMKGVFYDAVLVRTTPGTPNPSTPYIPATDTTASYACKAIVEQYSDHQIANGLVNASDRKILVLVNSLSVVPQVATDSITVLGTTYKIVAPVKTDPARAVWEVKGNGSALGELTDATPDVVGQLDFSNSDNSGYAALF